VAVDKEPLLKVDGLEVRYEGLVAVQGLSLDVYPGSATVLLGVNGAGRSSVLKAVTGFAPIAAGAVLLDGEDIGGLPAHRRAERGMTYLPEGRGVFPTLTVEENILTAIGSRADRAEAFAQVYDFFPKLSVRKAQRAGSLSGGEQQMVSLARCLAAKPRIMLLDELSLGLAPLVVRELFENLAKLRDMGVAILLVEQFAHAALSIADYAGVIVRGRLTRFAPAADFAQLTPDELAKEFFGASSSA
jgi:branched-chain amino acid transport system ATP-binding protein